ncbi:MAG: CesT family type III secretion system chaperone [Parachlamydia sp.]|jgi:hypothetical protein|nr:CesT family type III secretion system chaperone [Parachlamydia sp.]
MVSSQFDSVLKEFEFFFNCPLQADQNNACLINMGIGVSLQMELNRNGLLLIGSRIADLTGGRFQDEVLKEALKSNGSSPPFSGTFGCGPTSHALILFLIVEPGTITQDKVTHLLTPFIAKAQKWIAALQNGEIPSSDDTPSSADKLPFGFKR